MRSHTVCTNCDWSGDGHYCSRCGQKRFHSGDLGIEHAWHHVLHELVHVDGKIFRSLKSLIVRPGELTLDFVEGRRARHVHPIRLFLLFLFLFFFFVPINPLMEIGANVSRGIQDAGPLRARLEARTARNGMTLEGVLDQVSNQLRAIAKPLELFFVIGDGLLLWMLFRKRRPFLAEHMTMALHLASFNTALQLTIGWARLYGPARVFVTVLVLVITGGYFLLAARRVYGVGWTRLVLTYLVMYVSHFLIVFLTVIVVLIAHLA
jgi:hypothetical protein